MCECDRDFCISDWLLQEWHLAKSDSVLNTYQYHLKLRPEHWSAWVFIMCQCFCVCLCLRVYLYTYVSLSLSLYIFVSMSVCPYVCECLRMCVPVISRMSFCLRASVTVVCLSVCLERCCTRPGHLRCWICVCLSWVFISALTVWWQHSALADRLTFVFVSTAIVLLFTLMI